MNGLPKALSNAIYDHVSLCDRVHIMCRSRIWASLCRETPLSVLRLRGTFVVADIGRVGAKSVSWTTGFRSERCPVTGTKERDCKTQRDEMYRHTAQRNDVERESYRFMKLYNTHVSKANNSMPGTSVSVQHLDQIRGLWTTVWCDADIAQCAN
jgi:hypothetical protein